MGIDVYLGWKGQTEEEKEAMITGFSIAHGHVGYLRGAYSNPEAGATIRKLFPGEWKEDYKPKKNELRDRLQKIDFTDLFVGYKHREAQIKSFKDFVELAEKKLTELGEGNVEVHISY